MNGYWSDADHEAHEMQCELEGERGEQWFQRETENMQITFWLESTAEMLDAMRRLREAFPSGKDSWILLDFATEDCGVTVSNIECEFARDIAQAVAEGIVLSDWTAEKARELLDRETIEHTRRYL